MCTEPIVQVVALCEVGPFLKSYLVYPVDVLRHGGICGMGGVLVQIKACKPHPIPHQSEVFTEVIGDH